MKDVVYCILEDGPYAGAVYEVQSNDRELQIRGHPAEGVSVYRRSRWCATKEAHRIVIYTYTRTLVI